MAIAVVNVVDVDAVDVDVVDVVVVVVAGVVVVVVVGVVKVNELDTLFVAGIVRRRSTISTKAGRCCDGG